MVAGMAICPRTIVVQLVGFSFNGITYCLDFIQPVNLRIPTLTPSTQGRETRMQPAPTLRDFPRFLQALVLEGIDMCLLYIPCPVIGGVVVAEVFEVPPSVCAVFSVPGIIWNMTYWNKYLYPPTNDFSPALARFPAMGIMAASWLPGL